MQSVRTVRSLRDFITSVCSFSNSSIFQFICTSHPVQNPLPQHIRLCPSLTFGLPSKTSLSLSPFYSSHTQLQESCAVSTVLITPYLSCSSPRLPCQILVASVSVQALSIPQPHLSSPTALSFPASLNSLPVSYILMFGTSPLLLALCIHSPAHTIHFLFP